MHPGDDNDPDGWGAHYARSASSWCGYVIPETLDDADWDGDSYQMVPHQYFTPAPEELEDEQTPQEPSHCDILADLITPPDV